LNSIFNVMILLSLRSLLPRALQTAAPCSTGAAAHYFSSGPPSKKQAAPEDYSLAMKQAAEISAKVQQNPPEKEVGLVTGAPLEVFKRQVCVCIRGWGVCEGEQNRGAQLTTGCGNPHAHTYTCAHMHNTHAHTHTQTHT